MNDITLNNIKIERMGDTYVVSCDELFASGVGKSFTEALMDFGATMTRQWHENRYRIPEIVTSQELRDKMLYLFG